MKFSIPNTEFGYLDEGAYSVIFVDRKSSKIWKIFKKRHDAPFQHCKDVFEAEVAACELANDEEDLAELVPKFYGVVEVPSVIDASGADTSKEFYRSLAYQADYVPGSFVKFANTSERERKRIMLLFGRYGILVRDSCVVLDGKGRVTKVIDYSTKDVELEW